jgi:general secretion pathway protein E
MASKTLAEILLAQGSITQEQLTKLQTEAAEKQIPLEEYIRQQKEIPVDAIAKAYAEKYGVPVITAITEKMAHPDILAQVPLRFLRDHLIIPVVVDEATRKVGLVTSNPADFQTLDELRLIFGSDAEVLVATPSVIIDAMNKYYPLEGTKQVIAELAKEEEFAPEGIDLGSIESEDILGMATEAPIIKLVNHILYQAVKQEASDIHIEPFEKELHVRYRIDGVLHLGMMPPKRAQGAIVSRIKIMANMNIAEKRIPLDGRIQLKIADKAIDLRVSTIPTSYGERVVMRLLDKTKTFGQLTQLGFSERDFAIINKCIKQPNGIMLITGPTGSGKTSTLYSILSELNSPDVNIITVEDPVEYQMMGVAQVQVNDKVGLTFAAALRSILRQDPDIIMIGETRDNETAQIAIQSALTGHLVLSTLHTNSAAATITRLIDMGIEPFLIASTIIAAVAQRLVRRLCDACKQKYDPAPEVLQRLGLSAEKAKTITFYKAVGCEVCMNTGFKGRLPLFEVMEMTYALSRLIMERADTAVLQKQARADGMTLLLEDGIRKIAAGLTTIEEVLSETAVQGFE